MRSEPPTQQDEASRPAQVELSVSQRRLWVLERLNPQNPVHNVSCGLRLEGALDVDRLERAWRDIVQDHEILRTRFQTIEGTPQPLVADHLPPLTILNVTGASADEQNERLLHMATAEARRPLDVSRGPLIRGLLFRLAASQHVFLLVAHRIACDDASLNVLANEIASGYESFQGVDAPTQGPAPMQRGDFVSEQNKLSTEGLSYWNQRLGGAPSSLDLPTDRPRPAEQTFQGACQTFSIGKQCLDRLKGIGDSHGVTSFTILLSAFDVLLSIYSRQDDVIVGTAVSGRNEPALKNTVGPLENIVVLRTDLSGEPSFTELLGRVHSTVEEAFSHQDVPLELLLEELPLERDLSRNPLFQVAFGIRQNCAECQWAGGIAATTFEIESGTERFDLSLDLTETADSIHGRLSYSIDLWEAATIDRMVKHYTTLLAGFAADPGRSICDVSPLTEAERHKVLIEFNATAKDYRRDLCIHDFFAEQAERTPEATAVVCGHERLSYRELNIRANRLGHYLRRQGVGPEVLVGICAERSLELLVGILGILKAGGAYVPLDPAYPRDRLAVILEDAKTPILLTQQKLKSVLPQGAPRLIFLDSDWPEIAQEPGTHPSQTVASNNLGYVLFTSGSTGRPKGVALEHRSAATFIQWARDVFLPEEIAGTLLSTSVCFDLSVFEMFVPLSMGGKVIIAQNALELPKLPAAREVTLINTVPSAITELLRMGAVPPSVRVVNLAGEALLDSLAQQIYEKTQVRKVYNLYGPTEDTTYSTYTLVPRGGEVTIGKPLPNTQAYILDKHYHPLPIGVPGELYLAGDGLARGYFGREDLTQERFVANPFEHQAGARMYRTGDLARFLPDGNIQYLGRIDNQVKVRGFRIELEEIESVLTKHPSVQAAVVIAREDIPGDKRLVAYVVPSSALISVTVLKDAVRSRLPEFMVPSFFVEMEALPLSPNGKINRKLLPAPDQSATNSDVAHARDELESTLVKIWRNVLGIPNIGIRDNFFDLGGHSLKAARLITEVGEATGIELPLSALFRGATVESLAQLIRNQEDAGDPVVMEIQRGENQLPPFFAIVPPGEESLGYAMLARHMGPKQTLYKVQGHTPITNGKRPYSKQEMQDLTEEYIVAMRTVQPRGPYCLGGLCDGTHIAEQIVLSLEAQGEEMGLFAIFDTWVMQHSQVRWLWRIHYYFERLRRMTKMKLGEQIASYKSVAENRIDILRGEKTRRTDWRETYWPEGFITWRFRAPVVLFKRPKQPFYYIDDPQMGWGLRSEGGVEIHEIDFDHEEILREPHVRQFGEILAECLARVSRSTGELASADNPQGYPTVPLQQVRQGS